MRRASDLGAHRAWKGTFCDSIKKAAVQWLNLLVRSWVGGICLADDMGLGKTIQVLSLLLVQSRRPSLLVAPASLLANWVEEIHRFAPSLKARIIHPSAMTVDEAKRMTPERLTDLDLAITSYGSLLRLQVFGQTGWRFVILDEAQAIKNPNAKQTRAAIASQIGGENCPDRHTPSRITIWATSGPFSTSSIQACWERPGSSRTIPGVCPSVLQPGYGPLRDLVRPYILRRMKTDKTVISDLPDKTEVKLPTVP